MLLNLSVIVIVFKLGPLIQTGVVSFGLEVEEYPEITLLSFFLICYAF